MLRGRKCYGTKSEFISALSEGIHTRDWYVWAPSLNAFFLRVHRLRQAGLPLDAEPQRFGGRGRPSVIYRLCTGQMPAGATT